MDDIIEKLNNDIGGVHFFKSTNGSIIIQLLEEKNSVINELKTALYEYNYSNIPDKIMFVNIILEQYNFLNSILTSAKDLLPSDAPQLCFDSVTQPLFENAKQILTIKRLI